MDRKKDDKTDAEKKAPKKDILAELNLPKLYDERADATKKQKEATDNVNAAQAGHLVGFWLGGWVIVVFVLALAQGIPEDSVAGIFFLSIFVVIGAALIVLAFFPKLTVRKRQDAVTKATKDVKDIETKIAFCNVVLEEAKSVKLRKYAEAWVENELSAPPKT